MKGSKLSKATMLEHILIYYQYNDFADVFLIFSAAFLTQTVCLDETTVKFEIWDTAGQERYHSLAPMYYRGAQAAIVVYDITNAVSFTLGDNTSLISQQ